MKVAEVKPVKTVAKAKRAKKSQFAEEYNGVTSMEKKNIFEVQRTTGESLSAQQHEINDDVVAGFVSRVKSIISQARGRAGRAVNFAMVDAYWQIGKEVIERQGGAERAKYGDGLIKASAARLRGEMGKNIDERELRKMRQFYLLSPIRDARRPELGWAHYREVLSVQDEKARNWYVNEAVVKYSVLNESRQLFASRYVLELPMEDELRRMIEQGRMSIVNDAEIAVVDDEELE